MSWQGEEKTGAGKLQLPLPGSSLGTLLSGERDTVQVYLAALVGLAETGETARGCQAGEEQGSGWVGLSALEGDEGSPDPLAKPGAILLGEGRLQVARGKGWETRGEQWA